MTNENTFPHPVGDAIHKAACFLMLLFGSALFVIVVYSLNLYTADLAKIRLWCSQNKACTTTPTFGTSILRVHRDKQQLAAAFIGTLAFTNKVPNWATFEPLTLEIETQAIVKEQGSIPKSSKGNRK
jgi:hypothetical protein